MVVERPVVAPGRLVPGPARREHPDRLVVHPVPDGAVEHVADDRGAAAVAVWREGAVWGEGDAEGDEGVAGGVGEFVLVEELAGR